MTAMQIAEDPVLLQIETTAMSAVEGIQPMACVRFTRETMINQIFLRTLVLLFGLASASICLHAQAPADEKAKIEALISHVEGLESATFIRNGKDYTAANAAKFLRAKWQRDDKEVKTAADFIAKVASVSGTSGKPYVIRLKDGKEVPCGEYLTAQLKKQ